MERLTRRDFLKLGGAALGVLLVGCRGEEKQKTKLSPEPTATKTPTPTRATPRVGEAKAPTLEPTRKPTKTATATPKVNEAGATPELVTKLEANNWPQSAEKFVSWATEGQPESDGSWMPIELEEVHRAVGEVKSWVVAREKDREGRIIPFWVRNPTDTMQDGWMHNKLDRDTLGRKEPESARGSGIPAGWSGLAQGMTFRPKEEKGE